VNCDSCSNKEAVRLSYRGGVETCDRCGDVPAFKFSDVYFPQKSGAHFVTNLADPNKSQLGNMVYSREHKAQLMRDLGVKESGDRVHGAR
jgi:hypothetical protein